MKVYQGKDIRNLSLVGHSGAGKTTLAEGILRKYGYIDAKGSIDAGNTVSDFTKEEIDRKISIYSTLIPIEKDNTKINFIDTPGAFDFSGEIEGSLAACEGAVLVIDGSSGIQVGTEKAWRQLNRVNKPTIAFVNKMDVEDINFDELVGEINEFFGNKGVMFTLPIGSGANFEGGLDIIDNRHGSETASGSITPEGAYEYIKEKVAEADEELLEKYFQDKDFSEEELKKGIKKSIVNGDLVPIIFGSIEKDLGLDHLIELIEKYMPSPIEVKPRTAYLDDNEIEYTVDENEEFSALIFKTIIDPFIGKLSMFKVLTGEAKKDLNIYNSNKNQSEKMGHVFLLRGENQVNVDSIKAGDIGVTSKLDYADTGDTLSVSSRQVKYEPINFPKPIYYIAINAKNKSDEDKIGISLNRLSEEDPTFVLDRNSETKQLLIGGQGNMQLEIILDKLKKDFGVEVEIDDPKVAYRETIRGKSDVQGKHKKQSGGAGQYGDVFIRFEPSEEEFEFTEEVFGGAVPRNYFPAVEKGIEDALEEGVLGGFPVVNIKATLYDGSYHPVDSNEMAFKIAASMAFKEGMKQAQPVLLEPIMKMQIVIPESYMGDVMGDMTKRRGRIMGMDQQPDGTQLVTAEAPQAELFKYAIELRSMTQARGEFEMEFLRYDQVPKELEEIILKERKSEE